MCTYAKNSDPFEDSISENDLECYNFLQICDHVCDCIEGCIDESQCLETLPPPQWAEKSQNSLVLSDCAFNDFWRIVKLPSNGTLSLRVPFATQGKLYLEANSQGFRGVANLGSRIVDTGTNVRFHMELPIRANFEEILSLRISGINKGNIHIRRTFGIYSNSPKSFTFLSANGLNLDTSSKLITIEVPPHSHQVMKVPIKPLSLGRITIHAR